MNIKKVIPAMLSVALASVLTQAPSKTDRADAAVINYSFTLSDTNVGTSPRFMGENVTEIEGLTDSEKSGLRTAAPTQSGSGLSILILSLPTTMVLMEMGSAIYQL